jgi:hypothetical protein
VEEEAVLVPKVRRSRRTSVRLRTRISE